jgi:GT2 family glycosyltransferase
VTASASPAPRIVVLGMMSRIPVPGVVWQTVHYLLGLTRLGYDVYYVEDNGMTPRGFFSNEHDGWDSAAEFVDRVLRDFGLADRWAIHAEYGPRRHYGMSASGLAGLYRSAALIINLHGSTRPRPEHAAAGRLVFLETDPVELQVQVADGAAEAIEYLEAHCAFFTFGENIGTSACSLPRTDRFEFWPTRQPVLMNLWEESGQQSPAFTTIGNWRQPHRTVVVEGQTYHWTKDLEFKRFLDLPRRTGQRFELALASLDDPDRELLASHGWTTRAPFLDYSQLVAYQKFILGSLGEFTVAKEQNIRFRTGWFSDRSATYLAGGRPVITQDTGFSANLPVGKGLFSVTDIEEAVAAVEEVAGNSVLHSRSARDLALEFFDSDVVLTALLERVGMRPARRSPGRPRKFGLNPDLDIRTVGRWPTKIVETTLAAAEAAVDGRLAESALATRVASIERPEVSVVVVAHDHVEFTALCLESVLAATDNVPFEVVVVDNGSTDRTAPYLQALRRLDPRVRFVRLDENGGFGRGTNAGIAVARGRVIVLLNNDTIVGSGWLRRLIRHLDEGSIGFVGPVTNHTCNEAQVSVTYRTFREFQEADHARSVAFEGKLFDLDMLAMFCVAGLRSTFDAVGELDEGYGVGLFEDDDYSERARVAGLRLACVEDVLVHHFGEVSLGTVLDPAAYQATFDANRARFETTWRREWHEHARRLDPAYEELRARVARTVERVVPVDLTVLLVAKGDSEFAALIDRPVAHYPGSHDGRFLNEYPIDGAAAAQILEHQIDAGGRFLVLPRTSFWWLEHYAEFHSHLDDRHGPVVHLDEDCAIWRLRPAPSTETMDLRELVVHQSQQLSRMRDDIDALRTQLAELSAVAEVHSMADLTLHGAGESDAWSALELLMDEVGASKRARYLLLRARLREVVSVVTPVGATVAFISHGDEELLAVSERTGWHLPRMAGGQWSAGLPEDADAAIQEVELLRALGADFLVLPAPYDWWLEHYKQFGQHLARHYRAVFADQRTGWIWDLGSVGGATSRSLDSVVSEARRRAGRELNILDWDTGLDLAEWYPDLTVFSPPAATEELLYLPHTIDIVALNAERHSTRSALPVASIGVVEVKHGAAGIRAVPTWTQPHHDGRSVVAVAVADSDDRRRALCLARTIRGLPSDCVGIVLAPDISADVVLIVDGAVVPLRTMLHELLDAVATVDAATARDASGRDRVVAVRSAVARSISGAFDDAGDELIARVLSSLGEAHRHVRVGAVKTVADHEEMLT